LHGVLTIAVNRYAYEKYPLKKMLSQPKACATGQTATEKTVLA